MYNVHTFHVLYSTIQYTYHCFYSLQNTHLLHFDECHSSTIVEHMRTYCNYMCIPSKYSTFYFHLCVHFMCVVAVYHSCLPGMWKLHVIIPCRVSSDSARAPPSLLLQSGGLHALSQTGSCLLPRHPSLCLWYSSMYVLADSACVVQYE